MKQLLSIVFQERPNLKNVHTSFLLTTSCFLRHPNYFLLMFFQLPGRTDNEIKNFWNTRMKRRQRAGLPIYPPEILAEANAYNNHILLQHEPFSSSSSSSFSLLLSSCYPKKLDDPNTNSYDYNPLQNNSDSAYTHPYPQFSFSNDENLETNENLALKNSPSLSPYPSPSSNVFNQGFTPPSDHSYGHQYSENLSYDHHGFNGGSLYDSATTASSYASGVNDYYEVAPLSSEGRNSGLLDDLVKEGRSISSNDKGRSLDSNKRKRMEAEEYEDEGGIASLVSGSVKKKKNSFDETQKKDFSSSELSTGETTFSSCSLFI